MRTPVHALLASMAVATLAALVAVTGVAAQSPSAAASPSVAPPAGASPDAGLHADLDLEARMPTSIGGQVLAVQSLGGTAVFAGTDEAAIQPLLAVIAAQGLTLDDVSIAVAYNEDYSVAITAMRAPGGDARALVDGVLGMAAPGDQVSQAPGRIAGKEVIVVTDRNGPQQFYPQGDILWIIRATEPALTEILTALP
jgi:hypothetical protein